MVDPISLILISGAAGGAAGKFVETTLTSAGSWVADKYAHHQSRAIEKAQSNSKDFLNKLGEHLGSLEEQGLLSAEQITSALESPDFSMALHNALLGSAQTESEEKHDYLSMLVVDHLTAKSESTLALSSKLACTVVSQLTVNQLNLLGLLFSFRHITITPMTPIEHAHWREKQLSPFIGTVCETIDWQHLQSMGCLQNTAFSAELRSTFQAGNPAGIDSLFFETKTFQHIQSIWNKASTLSLTTLGMIIGGKVSERHTGQRVSFATWGEH